jgi:hypothetical protein
MCRRPVLMLWCALLLSVVALSCALEPGDEAEPSVADDGADVPAKSAALLHDDHDSEPTSPPAPHVEGTINEVLYTCDPPQNGVCLGEYGRVCRTGDATWCQVWVCGDEGCDWQLPQQ